MSCMYTETSKILGHGHLGRHCVVYDYDTMKAPGTSEVTAVRSSMYAVSVECVRMCVYASVCVCVLLWEWGWG